MRLRSVLRLALLVLSTVTAAACGEREFSTEREAIAHFREHRKSFERAADIFLTMRTPTIEIPEAASSTGTEDEFVQLSRALQVSGVSAVPGVAPAEEQWVQFRLGQRLLTSSYGLIFVPDGRGRALDSIKAQVDSPPRGVRSIRPIEDRWFYFDHD